MPLRSRPRIWIVAAGIVSAALPSYAQNAPRPPASAQAAPAPQPAPAPQAAPSAHATPGGVKPGSAGDYQTKLAAYQLARRAFDTQLTTYWNAISDKRRVRLAKQRGNEPVGIDDYVLTQPPVYKGPQRPLDPAGPTAPDPTEVQRPEIPVVADFLKAAADQFGFVPNRPKSDQEFKLAYAKVATAAGLTRDQVVRIYAFETGGNGTYDVQAGLTHPRPGARAISPAVGYNQLLSTNSISLMAEHGDMFLKSLRQIASGLSGEAKAAMEQKIEAVKRMIAFSRSVPNAWSEHDILAKKTLGGRGIHAAILDRDLGPLMQTQKLLNSVRYAKAKGYKAVLTGAELEMMNFTGDSNGLDMVMMPAELRDIVPTSNFFQQSGYERNPIARRTGVVATLFDSIEKKMDQASQLRGARELAEAFY
jgi:hypothetical protein